MIQSTPRFCERCGAQLGQGTRFCEACGTPIEAQAEHPQSALPSGKTRKPLSSGRSWMPWAAVAGLMVVGLLGATGWWLWRGSTTAEELTQQTSVSPFSEATRGQSSTSEAVNSTKPQVAIGSHLVASAQAEPAVASSGFDERGLSEWVTKQGWFGALRESMPKGVRVNFHLFEGEGEDAGWDMIELREFRSFDSGYDPDVSPMIGLFRVTRDRSRTEVMDPVTAAWISPDAFMAGRSLGADDEPSGDPRPISAGLAGAGGTVGKASTPGKGAPERKAICDAVREHIQTFHSREKLPEFLFVVEHLKTNGNAAAFKGYPVNPDGSPMDSALGDTVFDCLLTEENGQWLVVVDLTRSDVPTPEEVTSLRNGVPIGFPPDVLTDFWRKLLFP